MMEEWPFMDMLEHYQHLSQWSHFLSNILLKHAALGHVYFTVKKGKSDIVKIVCTVQALSGSYCSVRALVYIDLYRI